MPWISVRRIAGTRRSAFAVLAALLFTCLPPSGLLAADPSSFSLPIRCEPGKNCWIANYVDIDAANGKVLDQACGVATYDGHRGTDFAIADLSVMRSGVPVLAAAEGTVVGIRDGVSDAAVNSDEARTAVRNRECGNGVRIDHGNGWFTQYCHMRKGSIAVHTGDSVARGQRIGLVGISGLAEFPHVHFQIERDGKVIDPFVGAAPGTACGREHPLWDTAAEKTLSYEPTAIYNAGFAGTTPRVVDARDGRYRDAAIDAHSDGLVLWAEMYWVREGDRVTLTIRSPKGTVMHTRTVPIERAQARRFVYSGLRRKVEPWPAGEYAGEITLERSGKSGKRYTATRSVLIR